MVSNSNNDVVTFTAVGDVIVGRKDWENCFSPKAKEIVRAADISFMNSETTYSDKGSPGGRQALFHDPWAMPAIKDAGFDIATLANNHTLNWGQDALLDCLERFKALGIATCGAGKNMDEARKPAVVERKGVKLAVLGYLSVGPNEYAADANKAGAAMLRAHTHYEPYEFQPGCQAKVLTFPFQEDMKNLQEDVRKAKETNDIVIMTSHWGLHNVRALIPDYEYDYAYAAIDAGADMVIGTHTHILKGVEIYKGKVIAHNIANFVMESSIGQKEGGRHYTPASRNSLQRHQEIIGPQGSRFKGLFGEHKHEQDYSMILKAEVSTATKQITRVAYTPIIAKDGVKVLSRNDPEGQEVVDYLCDISAEVGFNTRFSWDGDDEVLIHTT